MTTTTTTTTLLFGLWTNLLKRLTSLPGNLVVDIVPDTTQLLCFVQDVISLSMPKLCQKLHVKFQRWQGYKSWHDNWSLNIQKVVKSLGLFLTCQLVTQKLLKKIGSKHNISRCNNSWPIFFILHTHTTSRENHAGLRWKRYHTAEKIQDLPITSSSWTYKGNSDLSLTSLPLTNSQSSSWQTENKPDIRKWKKLENGDIEDTGSKEREKESKT
jgi:hypothetical protein